jgi:D-alanyl-lipoteichoic acid acyltransferase DltB (MBOAT superfamily)
VLFTSHLFILLFLPAVLAGWYALAPWRRARQAFVVAASLVFYGAWDVRFVPLLAGLTVANWLLARWFGAGGGRAVPLLGVVLNLAVLALFKYADFLRGTVFALLGEEATPWRLVLPLGISFFVFQKISYLIDLRRGDRHIYSFLDFSLFVTFFPQLIAGPLVRHNEIVDQFALPPRRAETWENIGRGLALFAIGAVKKTAIADTLGAIADPLFARAAHGPIGGAAAWAACAAYTLQIYFDFSGYSDMAIGIARMFGLRLPFNFDAPYRAVSVRDFWRRWHMTLSRFLRDYLYVPLGGNRRGAARQVVNVVLTMLLGGLWHGAAWTFVAWGGLHGAALAVNHLWHDHAPRLPRALGWALTLLFVMAAWVLFRAPDFATAGRMLAAMATLPPEAGAALRRDDAAVMAVAFAVATLGPTSQASALARLRPSPWLAVPVAGALIYVLLLIGGRAQNAFIYFQF